MANDNKKRVHIWWIIFGVFGMAIAGVALDSQEIDTLPSIIPCDQEGMIIYRNSTDWMCINHSLYNQSTGGTNVFDQWGNTTDDVIYNSVETTSSTTGLNLSNGGIWQRRASSYPNFLGLTYMRGAKVLSTSGKGYYTFGAEDGHGLLYFENPTDYAGRIVRMYFNLTDEAIHVENPILIDISNLGLDVNDPVIEITDGITTASFSAGQLNVDSVNVATLINGSPYIDFNTPEGSEYFLTVGNGSRLGSYGLVNYDGFGFCPGISNPNYLYSVDIPDFNDNFIVGDSIEVASSQLTITNIVSSSILEVTPTPPVNMLCEYAQLEVIDVAHTLAIKNDGSFSSDLIPNLDNIYQLGLSDKSWKKLYVEEISGFDLSGAIMPDSDFAYDLGQSGNSMGTVHANSFKTFDTVTFAVSGQPASVINGRITGENNELKIEVTNGNQICNLNTTSINCTKYYGDGSALTGIGGSETYPQNQWTNTTTSLTSTNFTNNGNYVSAYDNYDIGTTIQHSNVGNILQIYGGCQWEGTANEFLCNDPFNIIGTPQKVNVTGYANSVVMALLGAGVSYTKTVSGKANFVSGTVSEGDSYVSGMGNIVAGTGGFNVTGTANLVVGNQNDVYGTGNLVSGQLHTIEEGAQYCTLGGALNVCGTSYGTAFGYDNEVQGATGVAIGRINYVGGQYAGTMGYKTVQNGRESYSFGRYVNNSKDYTVTIGNGETYGLNNDIEINYTEIVINKTIRELSGITGLHNNPHIEVWNTTENGYTFTISSLNTWYNITGLQIGEYQDFTPSGQGMIADYSGTYKVDWSMSFSGTGGSTHKVGLLINGQAHEPCSGYRKLGTAGDVGNMGSTCLITLQAGDNVTGAVQDINAPAQNINIWSVNANLVRVNE